MSNMLSLPAHSNVEAKKSGKKKKCNMLKNPENCQPLQAKQKSEREREM